MSLVITFAVGLLSFSPISRREAFTGIVTGSIALATPLPAFAQRSALVPKSSAESTASFKAYQLSKPGEATPEFIAAEQKRKAQAEKLAANPNSKKEESADEMMVRLGLKTMVQAEADGSYDCSSTWRGCNRN